MAPFPFFKPSQEPLRTTVGTNPCADSADEKTAFARTVAAPAPGLEDPATTTRQQRSLDHWRELAGTSARAIVSRTAGGIETVLAADGSALGDSARGEELLKAVKGTRPFREAASAAAAEAKEAARNTVRAYEKRLRALESLRGLAPEPRDRSWYEHRIEEAKGWRADTVPFTEPEPSLEAIALELGQEARQAVNPLAFWKTTKLREEYVAERARDRIEAARAAWSGRRDAWNATQEKKTAAMVAAREQAVSQLQAAMNGDAAYVQEGVARRLRDLDLSLMTAIEVGFSAPSLRVSFELAGENGVPTCRAVTLKSGWLRIKALSDSERQKLAAGIAQGLAELAAAVGLDVSPAVETVHVTVALDGKTIEQRDFSRPSASSAVPSSTVSSPALSSALSSPPESD